MFQSAAGFAADARAKNIILFIGDGMGPVQVQAALFRAYGQTLDAQGNPPKFSFEKFPAMGYLTTFSDNSFVTDSAAAGTAIACGQKTGNGMLGCKLDSTPVQSIASIAHVNGKAVGIISSVAFNHATPAAFYAFDDSRNDYDDITSQVFTKPVADVVMGGGLIGKKWPPKRLQSEAQKNGVQVYTCDNFDQLTPAAVGSQRVLGIFDTNKNNQLDFESSRTAETREPHLSQLAAKTLDLLKRDPDGFFLMVESGSIDWACHGKNADAAIGEILEFEKTVTQTIEFLRREGMLEQTLLIVTADHETGGMSIPGPYKKNLVPGQMPEIKFTGNEHTALPVFVWAQGPGSEAFRGKNDNTHVFRVMASQLR